MKNFLLLLLILSASAFSSEDIKSFKKDLVLQMKVLFKANQEIYPLEVKIKKMTFLDFIKIKDAYASSAYQCLYGGWPSRTIKVGGKTYCHNGKNSDFYRHSYACRESEFTCPSVLFGKDVCVPYVKRVDRLSVYNNCEQKEKEPTLSDDFKQDDFRLLVEYAKLSKEICESKDQNVVKVNCDKIQEKAKKFEDLVRKSSASSKKTDLKVTKNTEIKKIEPVLVKSDCISCEAPKEKIHRLLQTNDLSKITSKVAYEELKKNFRESKLCNPLYNYPEDEQKIIPLNALGSIRDNCSTWGRSKIQIEDRCTSEIMKLKSILKPTEEEFSKWEAYRDEVVSTQDDNGMYRLMLLIKKQVYEKDDKSIKSKLAQKAFLDSGVLVLEEREVTCPFPSFDAFDKAFTGYNKLKSSLSKKVLTIVDYTMPTNQRRLFSFDMEKLTPLYNTWAAHGMGNEDYQSSGPEFSNESGSNLSSDGFIIAESKSYGTQYGDNILLKGIDINNSRIASRAIVLHGDSKTGGVYRPFSINKEDYKEKEKLLKETSPDSDNLPNMRSAANIANSFYPTVGMTWGCIGVPDLDAFNVNTGKYENQLQSLRRDLAPKTLIFSYSGEEMKSKYF